MSDNWIVVTGSSGGIGSSIARRAAEQGYCVAGWDTSDDASWADGLGSGAIATVVDVTDETSIAGALAMLPQPPSALVNCAGTNAAGSLLEVPAEVWRSVLDLNLTGTFLCARQVARSLVGRGGAIINIASVGGLTPVRNTGPYSASKAAVIRLTEQMAVEWAPHGIRVNAVAPGLIAAGLTLKAEMSAAVEARRNQMVPLGRPGSAEEIADAVLFLASPAATYITGETIVIDGGLSKTAIASLPTRYDTVDAG